MVDSRKRSEAIPESPSNRKASRLRKMVTPGRALFGLLLIIVSACFAFWWICLRMPGESWSESNEQNVRQESKSEPVGKSGGEPASKEARETERKRLEKDVPVDTGVAPSAKPIQALPDFLRSHVRYLAETIGERNLGHYQELCDAADYIENQMSELGYTPVRQTFQVNGQDCFNIEAQVIGAKQPAEVVIVGAHYDSFIGTPGANDNGSGTAAMLALAAHFKASTPDKTLRFVAFTNEEPPYFHTRGQMGSWVYAEKCSSEEQTIIAVLSLETMGYFSDEENSQKYPAPLSLMYPSTGNFIGFVSNLASRGLQRRVIKTFRDHAKVPSEGASLPEATPGVGWSDHWSFWQEGYPGIMITDTAPFRYPHYHLETDTIDKIDFETLAKVVNGLTFVIEDLISESND